MVQKPEGFQKYLNRVKKYVSLLCGNEANGFGI